MIRSAGDMASPSAPDHRAVATRFVLGSVIGAATFTMLGYVLGPAAVLLPFLGSFVGGAIAGTALRRSVGAAVGFGLAFVIGNVAGILPLV